MRHNHGASPRKTPENKKGFTIHLLTLSILLALLAGGIIGMSVTKLRITESDSSPSKDSNISDSEFQSLQRRVGFLENLLENVSGGTSGSAGTADALWPIDEIYEFVKPSVVTIEVSVTSQGIFGSIEKTVQGSGFVYDESGHIITNNHVVEGAEGVLVRFYNGETVEGEVIGSDPYSDVAVIDINEKDLDVTLHPLHIENSSNLETGERVVAVGSPYGLEGTTTFGIISQTGRVLSTETQYLIPGVLQIDAPINSGNSGGPLLNMEGEVIGITTAIQSQTGSFSGIGYAVTSSLVERVVAGLIENDEYNHAWLGVSGKNVTYEIAQNRGLERVRGFLIESVKSDSPASGKLKEDDVILSIGGMEISGIEDILSYIGLRKSPGDLVPLKVLRNGEKTTVEIELGIRPST